MAAAAFGYEMGYEMGLTRGARDLPDFTAAALSGVSVSADALRGHAVLMVVCASFVRPCDGQFARAQALHAEFASVGLRTVGIDVDIDVEPARAAQESVGFPVIHDPRGHIARQLHTWDRMPFIALYDPQGRIAAVYRGALRDADVRMIRRRLPSLLAGRL